MVDLDELRWDLKELRNKYDILNEADKLENCPAYQILKDNLVQDVERLEIKIQEGVKEIWEWAFSAIRFVETEEIVPGKVEEKIHALAEICIDYMELMREAMATTRRNF